MIPTDFFAREFPGHAFVFFSPAHWLALLILFSIYLALWYSKDWFKQPEIDIKARWLIAGILLAQELSLNVWRLTIGTWSAGSSLPLHLCGIAIILSAVALINRSYLLYELIYFWGLGGAIQALLTPDIGQYGFPHYRYFQFFLSHGTLIFAGLYLTWVGGLRPTHHSIWRVFAITNFYLLLMVGFNYITNGNYLFICHKPENGSIMDIMGPWPWYVLVLEGVAVLSFYLYYLPFAITDYFQHTSTASE